ncbi:MAG: hypothetical protein H6518_14770 [Microthrixaceae bacterium]|nr:hypothetical protein [Microthrixaceae bacterium]
MGEVVHLARRLALEVDELDRGETGERWLELALERGSGAGEVDEEVVWSIARAVEGLGVGFRLREHVTQMRPTRPPSPPADDPPADDPPADDPPADDRA